MAGRLAFLLINETLGKQTVPVSARIARPLRHGPLCTPSLVVGLMDDARQTRSWECALPSQTVATRFLTGTRIQGVLYYDID